MGDWFIGSDGAWHHTSDEPAPDPTVTAMLPAVDPTPRAPAEHPAAFDDPTSFPSYDQVDSRLIRTIGAPA